MLTDEELFNLLLLRCGKAFADRWVVFSDKNRDITALTEFLAPALIQINGMEGDIKKLRSIRWDIKDLKPHEESGNVAYRRKEKTNLESGNASSRDEDGGFCGCSD